MIDDDDADEEEERDDTSVVEVDATSNELWFSFVRACSADLPSSLPPDMESVLVR